MRTWKPLILSLALIFVLSLNASAASPLSGLNLSFQLMNSKTLYEPIFQADQATVSDWTVLINGTYAPTDDLLVDVTHSNAKGRTITIDGDENDLDSDKADRSFTQA